jgi:hypothetical protein
MISYADDESIFLSSAPNVASPSEFVEPSATIRSAAAAAHPQTLVYATEADPKTWIAAGCDQTKTDNASPATWR